MHEIPLKYFHHVTYGTKASREKKWLKKTNLSTLSRCSFQTSENYIAHTNEKRLTSSRWALQITRKIVHPNDKRLTHPWKEVSSNQNKSHVHSFSKNMCQKLTTMTFSFTFVLTNTIIIEEHLLLVTPIKVMGR